MASADDVRGYQTPDEPVRNVDVGQHRRRLRKMSSAGSSVALNVYDLVAMNEYTAKLGIGVFHSGLQVYGREYAYGAHPYHYTGIYDMTPQKEIEIANEGVKFRQSIVIGFTELSEVEVKEIILQLGDRFAGNVYHVLNRNCNHFTSELSQLLCGCDIPRWVNRLAHISSWMPFLLRCVPPSWLNPPSSSEERESEETVGRTGEMLSSASLSHVPSSQRRT